MYECLVATRTENRRCLLIHTQGTSCHGTSADVTNAKELFFDVEWGSPAGCCVILLEKDSSFVILSALCLSLFLLSRKTFIAHTRDDTIFLLLFRLSLRAPARLTCRSRLCSQLEHKGNVYKPDFFPARERAEWIRIWICTILTQNDNESPLGIESSAKKNHQRSHTFRAVCGVAYDGQVKNHFVYKRYFTLFGILYNISRSVVAVRHWVWPNSS